MTFIPMPDWPFASGLILAVAISVGSVGLLHSPSKIARLVSLFLLPLGIGWGVAWATRSWSAGVVAGLGWFLFPMVRFWMGIRELRVQTRKEACGLVASSGEFEALHEVAADWEEIGFEPVGDCEIYPSEHRQVFRLMRSQDDRHLVSIGWMHDGPMTLVHSAMSSWDAQGVHWMTWNYPLPYGLLPAPETRLWRCPSAETPVDLMQQHAEFLTINGSSPVAHQELSNADAAMARWLGWVQRQFDYNLETGWLRRLDGQGSAAYSWKGLFGASGQLLKAIVDYST